MKCANCLTKFQKHYGFQKYCSPKCRRIARTIREADKSKPKRIGGCTISMRASTEKDHCSIDGGIKCGELVTNAEMGLCSRHDADRLRILAADAALGFSRHHGQASPQAS